MANTLMPKGRIAPSTGKHSHLFDPVALHSEAITSISLAGFYLRRDNVAQARRKLRQALQALQPLTSSTHTAKG
ncbi:MULTISPECIES: hypothetical protein [Giesbergeria]|uniref:Uncharacterized protein n=1 Tax=Giesbergeria sinuosa TaxID=80883 RepID=A0ABV9QGJ2_9BURK